jgi:hypothetical protein
MIVGVILSEVTDIGPLTEGGPWVRFAEVERADGVWCGVRDCNEKLSLMSPARD